PRLLPVHAHPPLPPLRARRLAGAGADRRAPCRGRARRCEAGPAARSARDWRYGARTCPGATTGGTRVLTNDLPRYEILDEAAMGELERGWRRIVSDLGIEFLYEEALDYFRNAGQNVEGQLVQFDPDWV